MNINNYLEINEKNESEIWNMIQKKQKSHSIRACKSCDVLFDNTDFLANHLRKYDLLNFEDCIFRLNPFDVDKKFLNNEQKNFSTQFIIKFSDSKLYLVAVIRSDCSNAKFAPEKLSKRAKDAVVRFHTTW